MNKQSFHKILLLLFSVLVLTSISCSKSTKQNETSNDSDQSLEKLKEKGKIVAITGYNAYSYFIYKGRIMGYEYELIKRFADRIGVDVEIKISKNLDEMFELLEDEDGDIITYNLTITKERQKKYDFTHFLNTTHQVLVQRKPENWRNLTLDQISDSLIRNPIDLENKTIYVRKGSAYKERLENLSDEIGGSIEITEAPDSMTVEDLIKLVAEEEIDYTISDENIAHLNEGYYPILDIETPISLKQKTGWAVKKGSNSLLKELNTWIDEFKKEVDFYVIYDRYYKYRNYYKARRKSEFFLDDEGKISIYDDIVKKYSEQYDWDWRLISAIIFEESGFDPEANSWANAVGLMQLLPQPDKGLDSLALSNPETNIKAGIEYLNWLNDYWLKTIPDDKERINFVLASYNIGFGHVEDAMALAAKYEANPRVWFDNVEKYLLLKSKPKYYNDPVVRNGYSNGMETVSYVKNVINRYEIYSQFTN